ncbi:MAG: hypothetical protein HYZ44_13330 [Bacteroidetes bacterium]|nr:hypothetical protein [Bacteroidota bacterium]
MDIQTQKLILIEQLLHVDDTKIIDQVREILNNSESNIIGYELTGIPISKRDLLKKIELAEKEFKEGNYQTIDEFEKESEGW